LRKREGKGIESTVDAQVALAPEHTNRLLLLCFSTGVLHMSRRHRHLTDGLVIAMAMLWVGGAVAGPQRSVVELFTSQGCSSCPPADALAGRLATNPALLVLSFHVNYWDGPGWKDTFSSEASTDRQYRYARSLGERSVFTPHFVVNGTQSVVGSQEASVQHALAVAGREDLPVKLDLEKRPDGRFKLTLAGPAQRGDVWAIQFVRHTLTRIGAGENGGRSLETFNDVTQIQRIGAFSPGTLELKPLTGHADGLAILVQAPNAGRVLGATAY
jgi:hypothetical protein